jgi:hypothetical protein
MIAEGDPRILTTRLSKLLLAIRKVSADRLRRILIAAHIPFAEMQVRELTGEERDRLVKVLRTGRLPTRLRPVPLEVTARMRVHGAEFDAVTRTIRSSVPGMPEGNARQLAEACLVAARDAAPSAPLVEVGDAQTFETADSAPPDRLRAEEKATNGRDVSK